MPAGTRSAAEAAGSTSVQLLGRMGLVGYGVVNLLLAWLTVQVAFGAGEEEAEAGKGGAVQHLAESPWGAAALWAIGIGLLALALWQLAEAVRGRDTGTLRRVLSVAEAVAFVALGVSAVRAAAGRGSGGSNQEQAGFTARVLEAPGGPVWVALAGGAVAVVAGLLLRKGLTRRFLRDLDLAAATAETRRLVTGLGQVGHVTVGAAYGVVGALLVVAAVRHDPEKATGLDTALAGLAEHRYGTALLLVVAFGLACFGAYCFLDARYRRS